MHRLIVIALWIGCWAFNLNSVRGAVLYNFQQYQGNGAGGPIGDGLLQLSNNTTTVRANLLKGTGSFVDNLVIFIDSTPGGFTSTSPFSDKGLMESAVSGLGLSRSIANFAPDFAADYAIVLGINSGSGIFKLVTDSTGSHLEVVRVGGLSFVYTDSPNHGSYSFQFDWTDIGLPSKTTNFFKFETSYITSTGYRYLESFEDLVGKVGFNTVTFTNYDTYGVPPVPENTNAALAVFGALIGTVALTKWLVRQIRAERAP
jgi:hypothetical protein